MRGFSSPRRSPARAACAAVLVLGAGALLLACGKANPATPASTSSAASSTVTRSAPAHPAPKAPSGAAALSLAEATAFARAVNLTPADVPGFDESAVTGQRETVEEKQLNHQLLHCAAGLASSHGAIPDHPSPNFKRRGSALQETVHSVVGFSRTPAEAAAELQILRSARTKNCLVSYFDLLFRGKSFGGAAIGHVSVTQGSPPAPGTTGGFGWRITTPIHVRGIEVPFYVDILGFVYGPTEVTLQSSGLLTPFPAAAEEQLFRLLVQRATSHGLGG